MLGKPASERAALQERKLHTADKAAKSAVRDLDAGQLAAQRGLRITAEEPTTATEARATPHDVEIGLCHQTPDCTRISSKRFGPKVGGINTGGCGSLRVNFAGHLKCTKEVREEGHRGQASLR